MPAPVFILATCRKPELLRASTMVFETIKVGFPTAPVMLYINDPEGMPPGCEAAIHHAAPSHTSMFETNTVHYRWIEHLAGTMEKPFWVCDTDMVFYEPVEDWKFETALAGRLTPQYRNDWLHCIERPRLHSSLLWIDPVAVRVQTHCWWRRYPQTPFTPHHNLWAPAYVPMGRGRTAWYDTGAQLYHALGGTAFTAAQLDAYSHAFFGTIEDLVQPQVDGDGMMARRRKEFFETPQAFKGCWREQQCWYAQRLA